jgi:hypothetical protein
MYGDLLGLNKPVRKPGLYPLKWVKPRFRPKTPLYPKTAHIFGLGSFTLYAERADKQRKK